MSQKHNIFHGKFVKADGTKLVPVSSSKAKYQEFVKGLEVGQYVEIFLEANQDDGTLAQLAKVHVCIRTLAKHSGYTFEEMKLELLKMAGLCFVTQHKGDSVLYCKSLADASKEELSMLIETIIQVGDDMGVNCRD
jgi:hypothetical protein